MKKPEISVIMPVYKVEAYVGKAIESILRQTFSNFELIAVDDGSPDRSGEICDEYAKKDERIRVIHQKNAGAPSARNVAMEVAVGDYFYFCDSDDWAEPDMLKNMLLLAKRERAQMVVCGFYIDTYYGEETPLSEKISIGNLRFKSQQDFREQAYKLYDRNLLYTPWNKLYLASYIREAQIIFPNTLWDDFPFNIRVVKDIERVVVSDKAYYHFIRARAESETATYRPGMYEKREEEQGWLEQLFSKWNVKNEPTMEMLWRRYIERFMGCIENLTNPSCTLDRKEKQKKAAQMLRNPRVGIALRFAKPRSLYMKVMLLPVRMKCVPLLLLEGKVITTVKRKHTKLFARLKAGR